MDRPYAFTGNGKMLTCVDCGAAAGNYLTYTAYSIGDVVCRRHMDWRLECVPRRSFGGPIPSDVRVVSFS